jgi:hypothetical protein
MRIFMEEFLWIENLFDEIFYEVEVHSGGGIDILSLKFRETVYSVWSLLG